MQSSSDRELRFVRLHLPRPLETDAVLAVLGRLSADRQLRRLVLEVRAGSRQHLTYLVGARPADLVRLEPVLRDFLPGCYLDVAAVQPVSRLPVAAAGRLRVRPSYLPLAMEEPETVSRAVLSALAVPLTADETLALQVFFGPRILPSVLPAEMSDPSLPLVHRLLVGERPAGAEVRTRLRKRVEHPGFSLTIRVGVSASGRDRRTALLMGVLSGLTVAQGPGTRIRLVAEKAERFNAARRPWWWPLRLSVPELTGLLAWPLGEAELPGLPGLHPRPLRAHTRVHQGARVFARSAAPGDDRLLGIAVQDQTFHGVAYGPSGSGKTNVLLHLILSDIADGRPVVVLDPKQQLIDDILARVPAERLPDIVELNAAEASPVSFNPLDRTGRDPDVVVDGILAVFAAVFADGFGPRTADIFSAALRTLARGSRPDAPASLIDIPRLLTEPAFRRPYVARVQDDLALGGFWAWYDSLGSAAQASIIAAPMNKLRQFLLRPAVVRMLEQRADGFRLRDVFRTNKVVLVPLNEGIIGAGAASLLGGLIVAEVWQATQERVNEPGAGSRPGMVYVDEAPRFVHLPTSLADALAISRSLSVGWFLAAQFRSQFPPDLRLAVDINARTKIAFATEYDDARDMAKLAPQLESEDFMALPRFHAYANLVADGAPTGWALVRTLPPPPRIADPEAVRTLLRARRPRPSPLSATKPSPAAARSELPGRIGRKRRSPSPDSEAPT